MDGPTNESTHHLLLALAGKVDDDLLGWARELAAVGEEARAVSLLTADITASRLPLPVPVRAALVAAGQAVRVDIDPDAMAAAVEDETCAHRFVADVGGQPDVAAALRALPARRLQDCTVHLAWRLTPAGTAPGALPHPVVVIEAEPGVRALDVLAYQVATGLARAGIHAGVEVLGVGQPRERYHEMALADALPVAIQRGAAAAPAVADEPLAVSPFAPDVGEMEQQPAQPGSAQPDPAQPDPAQPDPAQPDPAQPDPAQPLPVRAAPVQVNPVQADPALAGPAPAGPVQPVSARPIPAEPVTEVLPEIVGASTGDHESAPYAAADASAVDAPAAAAEPEFVFDASRPHPLSDDAILPPTRPIEVPPPARQVEPARQVPQARPIEGAPALAALNDPLNGPLNTPLLPPRFDPTIQPHDPLGIDYLIGPSESARRAAEEEPANVPEPAEAAPAVEDSWAAEWESGAWAMPVEEPTPPPVRDDTPHNGFGTRYGMEPGVAEFVPAPSAPAHDQPAYDQPAYDQPQAHAQPRRNAYQQEPTAEAARSQARPEPLPTRRAESSSRLTDADRELLARLQAELVEGRKPRVTRRAGVARIQPHSNGSNGSNGEEPPDIAG